MFTLRIPAHVGQVIFTLEATAVGAINFDTGNLNTNENYLQYGPGPLELSNDDGMFTQGGTETQTGDYDYRIVTPPLDVNGTTKWYARLTGAPYPYPFGAAFDITRMWVDLIEIVGGQWVIRQRQNLVGSSSWPLRQRQTSGTGSWEIRQRQKGL